MQYPGLSGKPYQRPTIAGTLGTLHRFFQTIQEWGWPEAPRRILIFASDRPVLDDPLPRARERAYSGSFWRGNLSRRR